MSKRIAVIMDQEQEEQLTRLILEDHFSTDREVSKFMSNYILDELVRPWLAWRAKHEQYIPLSALLETIDTAQVDQLLKETA